MIERQSTNNMVKNTFVTNFRKSLIIILFPIMLTSCGEVGDFFNIYYCGNDKKNVYTYRPGDGGWTNKEIGRENIFLDGFPKTEKLDTSYIPLKNEYESIIFSNN